MLTTKPIASPCVKHEIEGSELLEDCKDCRYCCTSQTVPFTPPSAVITECIGKNRLAMILQLICPRRAREWQEGMRKSEMEKTEI